jgi:hypothetical protein
MKHLLLFALLPFVGLSQTKLISHKSHSGTKKTWQQAFNNPSNSIHLSNLGVGPTPEVRFSRLDSLKVIRPNVVVMVTSYHCQDGIYRNADRNNNAHLWNAGSDTVYNHPDFNSDKSIEEIKRAIGSRYYFANSAETVAFVGYEKKPVSIEEKSKGKHELTKKKSAENNAITEKKERPSWFVMVLISIFNAFFKNPFR